MSAAVENLLSRLERVKRTGAGWQARCPAHEDRVASLSVSEGDDGRALVKCHAGCTAESVVGALGLRLADLFEREQRPVAAGRGGRNRPMRNPAGSLADAQSGSQAVDTSPSEVASAAEPGFRVTDADVERCRQALLGSEAALRRLSELRGWTREAVERLGVGFDGRLVMLPYRNEDGVLVGCGRYQPNPEKRGDSPKLKANTGSRRELFPAPETVEADGWLWLLEGEPDCIRATSLGLAAVAVPGVEGWRAGYAQRFHGRRVVVCFDCDTPGRQAAQRVAAELAPVAAEVRLLDLDAERQDGFDFSDFTAAAKTESDRGEMRRLLLDSAERAPRIEPPKPQDGAALLDELTGFLRRYVVLPGEHETAALVLFVVHTYALDAAHATPYLVVLSPERRSGKTLLLELLELLVSRPWRVVSTSEAAMFRKLSQDSPTLLLDEVDAIFGSASERTEPLRAILNAGNRPGSSVARCVGDGANQRVADFDVFGCKVLAGIDTGRLPDTIRDRAIELRMKRKTPGERVERFRRRLVAPVADELRERVGRWCAEHAEALGDAEPALPGELNDRAAEAWEPLLAIADAAGGAWPARARAAAVALAAGAELDETSYGTRLLGKLAELLRERSSVATAEVLEAVNADDELPFGGWRDGRGLDSRGLARLLRPYGIRPRTVRLDDGSTPKGYSRDEAAEEAFARYAAPLPQNPPQAPHPPQPPESATEKPLDQAVVADVADVADKSEGVACGGSEPPHDELAATFDALDESEAA